MLSLLQRHPLVAALSAIAALLVVAIGMETGFGSSLQRAIPAAAPGRATPMVAKLLPSIAASQPERLYPETTARPLFIPTRRPAPEVAAQGAFKPGQFVLQGVTIAGDTRIALLREKESGKIHRVEKGKEVNGVKVAEINPESVTLTQGTEQEVLPLLVLKPGPALAMPLSLGPFSAGTPLPAAVAEPGAPVAKAVGQPPDGFTPQVAHPGPAPTLRSGASPGASGMPQATTAPISPEELLARRRARRAQQAQ